MGPLPPIAAKNPLSDNEEEKNPLHSKPDENHDFKDSNTKRDANAL
jgi:hypothetical protein